MKDFWAEELQSRRKVKLGKLAILIILLIFVILITILINKYIYNLNFRKWCDTNILRKEILQEKTNYIELDGNEDIQVYAYDKYICILRKKNLEFYNKIGKQVGTIELDISKAIFTSTGRYLAICEDGGQKFYLICGREKIFENEIEGNINQINVSKSGYVSIVISNSSYKSIIDVYNKSGKQIFRTNLVTSRVVDISISQDSKYLAIAEIDISGILIKSSIQVVSIELAQSDTSKAMLYKYEAPIDKLILNIEYQEKGKIICMYSDSIDVLEDGNNKELLELKNRKLAFTTINLNNKIALLEEISTGEYTSDTQIKLINSTTLNTKEYTTNDVTKSIEATENKIAINTGTELYILDTNGFLRKKYVSEAEINDIVMTNSLVGVIYRDRIQIINL